MHDFELFIPDLKCIRFHECLMWGKMFTLGYASHCSRYTTPNPLNKGKINITALYAEGLNYGMEFFDRIQVLIKYTTGTYESFVIVPTIQRADNNPAARARRVNKVAVADIHAHVTDSGTGCVEADYIARLHLIVGDLVAVCRLITCAAIKADPEHRVNLAGET